LPERLKGDAWEDSWVALSALTLTGCATSGSEYRDLAPREALELTAKEKACFDVTLSVPDGDIGSRENLRLRLEARKMDLRKSACGREIIVKYGDLLDLYFERRPTL
jgi:hypothetical protein